MQSRNYHPKYIFVIIFVLFFQFSFFGNTSLAETVDELQQKIENKKKLQEQIDKELAEQKAKLDVVSKQKNTLQNTVNTLNVT